MATALTSLSTTLSHHPSSEMQEEEIIYYRWLKTHMTWKTTSGKSVFKEVSF